MGAKKQAVKSKNMWIKVLAIVAGVLFVVLMVVSAMGSSWISSLATIKPGDVAVVDYTLRDAQGNPILTSNQQLYTQLCQPGFRYPVLQAADDNGEPFLPISGIPVCRYIHKIPAGLTNPFALFASEYSAISSGIVGLKANDQKTISLASKSL